MPRIPSRPHHSQNAGIEAGNILLSGQGKIFRSIAGPPPAKLAGIVSVIGNQLDRLLLELGFQVDLRHLGSES